ncbi:MAG: DnaJ domain-containing protein [Flavobacteriales bacterium]
MTNYFHILGLTHGASDADVRKAYRALAKQYHPDINAAPGARQKFEEINGAYEFLTDYAQRNNYERMMTEQLDAAEQLRREKIYKLWVEHQQRQTRYRDAVASAYAQGNKKAHFSKLYGRANYFTNVMALIIFLSITVIPIYKYFDQLSLPQAMQRPFITFIIPAAVGGVLFAVGFYYWFVVKTDRG